MNRKTLLRKFRNISQRLSDLDREDLLPYEKSVAMDEIFRDIAGTWAADEIRRSKPTPQQEATGGIAVIETVLWDAVPTYLRKLNAQLKVSVGKELPIDAVPIKFASWIGGDRDGNPNVTPDVTLEVVYEQRLRAAKLFLKDLNKLYDELALSSQNASFSPEMEELAATVKKSFDDMEKYRRVIGHLRIRLLKTIDGIQKGLKTFAPNLDSGSHVPLEGFDDVDIIRKKDDLMIPLKTMYNSLVSTGYESVANGSLVDTIRRLAAFGTSLVPLDIREESTAHKLAIDAITQYLGLGSYASWNEETKINFLANELSSKRPLFKLKDLEDNGVDPSVLKTLRVFETISQFESECLGAYVISQTTSASDILAVMLLQQQFGMTSTNGKMMRVTPLFETLNDLNNAPEILATLFKVSPYVGAVKGKVEVMVGYSDSAKDAGR